MSWSPRNTVRGGTHHGAGILGADPSLRGTRKRSLRAAYSAPTAHPSTPGESSHGRRPAPGWRRLRADSVLAQLCLFLSPPSHEIFQGGCIWGTSAPNCVAIIQKWLLFFSILEFISQFCHFLCVTLGGPTWLCQVSALSSVKGKN